MAATKMIWLREFWLSDVTLKVSEVVYWFLAVFIYSLAVGVLVNDAMHVKNDIKFMRELKRTCP